MPLIIYLLRKLYKCVYISPFTERYILSSEREDFLIVENGIFQPLQISNLLDNDVVASHPAIQSLYQDAVIAEQTKKVERSQGLPDFTIGFTNQSLIGFHTVNGAEKYFNSGKRFNSVNIGIAIPITYGATKARIKSLDFRKQASEANAQQLQKALTTQLQNALQQYQQDMQQFNYFQQEALPNAKEIVSAAQLGYKTGEISYVEYLFALQTTTDIQLNYLKSIQQVNQSVISIYSLINQ